jgi:transcriptional regulator with XRE-family HTH domain
MVKAQVLRLTAERVSRGWSKARLARRAHLDQATLSKIEAGRFRPYPRELVRLARALNLPSAEADRLLELVDDGRAENTAPTRDYQKS